MDYKKMNQTYYLRIDKDEKIFETIQKLCQIEGIQNGHFSGIGACDVVTLATYIPEKNDFVEHQVTGMLEMVSLSGNIALDSKGELSLHSHGTFSYLEDEKVQVIAGHLIEAQISYTGEIVLEVTPQKIKRKFDVAVGIEVWNFE